MGRGGGAREGYRDRGGCRGQRGGRRDGGGCLGLEAFTEMERDFGFRGSYRDMERV